MRFPSSSIARAPCRNAPFSAPLLFAVTLLVFQPFHRTGAADSESPPIPPAPSSHPAFTTPTAQNTETTDLAHLTARAEAGDPDAQSELAFAYLTGNHGAPHNGKRAFALSEQAAAQGFAVAELALSWMYQEGIGTAFNNVQAFFWCKKAAEQGFPEAEDTLGNIYSRGLMGIPVNRVEGRNWYRKAALQHVPSSQAKLALCYRYGYGGAIDLGKALFWSVRAAESDDATAALLAASLYREGVGDQKPNLDLAWIWSVVADQHGLPNDQNRKTNVDLRKNLEAIMPAAQRARDDLLATRYQELDKSGGSVLRPDLIDRAEIPFNQARGDNKFELVGSEITVPVFIDGKGPFRFVFDTGSHASAIDPGLSKTLGLRPLGLCPSPVKVEESQSLVEANYSIFQAEMRHGVFAELPLENISRSLGKQIDGILGSDFIGSCVIEIDYEAKTMHFFDSDTYVHAPSAGAEISLTFWSGCPVIPVSLGGSHRQPITLPAIVDTGNAGSINLNLAFDREYSFAKLVPKAFPTNFSTVYGMMPDTQGRLQFLGIGPYQIPEPTAECDNLVAVPSPTASIGSEILRRFKLTLDYKHRRMFLEPNANLKKYLTTEWAGFDGFLDKPDSDTFRILKIYPDSPASKAGLREGDLISERNGASGREMMRQLVEPPKFSDSALSAPVERTGKVNRKGKIISFKLTPEPY